MMSTNTNNRKNRSRDSKSFTQDIKPCKYGNPNTSDVNSFEDFMENVDILHHVAHIVGNPFKLLIGILPKVSKRCGAAAEQTLALFVEVDMEPFDDGNLTFEGISAVIRRCPNIKKLSLPLTHSTNRFDFIKPFRVFPKQWHIFFKALKTNSVLQTLDLSKTGLSSEANYLADALMINSTLKELNLNYNQLGPQGAKHLAEALKTNSALQTLSLRGNELGADGTKHLSQAIKTNSTLKKLEYAATRLFPTFNRL